MESSRPKSPRPLSFGARSLACADEVLAVGILYLKSIAQASGLLAA